MGLRKVLLIKVAVVLCLLLSAPLALSQAKKEKAVSFGGVVEIVMADSRMIGINEAPVYLPPETKIFNEKGEKIGIADLKPGLYVSVAGVQRQKGFYATKVSVQPQKGNDQKPVTGLSKAR